MKNKIRGRRCAVLSLIHGFIHSIVHARRRLLAVSVSVDGSGSVFVGRPDSVDRSFSVSVSVDRSVSVVVNASVGRSVGRAVPVSVDRCVDRSVDRSVLSLPLLFNRCCHSRP